MSRKPLFYQCFDFGYFFYPFGRVLRRRHWSRDSLALSWYLTSAITVDKSICRSSLCAAPRSRRFHLIPWDRRSSYARRINFVPRFVKLASNHVLSATDFAAKPTALTSLLGPFSSIFGTPTFAGRVYHVTPLLMQHRGALFG